MKIMYCCYEKILFRLIYSVPTSCFCSCPLPRPAPSTCPRLTRGLTGNGTLSVNNYTQTASNNFILTTTVLSPRDTCLAKGREYMPQFIKERRIDKRYQEIQKSDYGFCVKDWKIEYSEMLRICDQRQLEGNKNALDKLMRLLTIYLW